MACSPAVAAADSAHTQAKGPVAERRSSKQAFFCARAQASTSQRPARQACQTPSLCSSLRFAGAPGAVGHQSPGG